MFFQAHREEVPSLLSYDTPPVEAQLLLFLTGARKETEVAAKMAATSERIHTRRK